MRLKLCCFFLFYIGCTLAEVLEEANNEDLDPIFQTEDEAEDSDQSKRFLFDDDANRYAWEKHVKLHGGHKYFLGYRPVRLQYLPVAKPLYSYPRRPAKFQGYYRHNLKQFTRPMLSLVPPKVHPIYKPLPVNVPPSIPQKPWETQGWGIKPVYGPPGFVPSGPDPASGVPSVVEPSATISPPVIQPTPVQPAVPSAIPPAIPPTGVPIYPNILPQPGMTTVHFLPKPVIPLPVHPGLALPTPLPVPLPAPLPLPTPVLPVPQPTFVPLPTSVPVHPLSPPVLLQKPLVPINIIPGKHLPLPNLGVLPLGASVPVQITGYAPNVVHKQILVQEPHVVHRPHQILVQEQPRIHLPQPGSIYNVPSVHLQGGFTPIQANPSLLPHQTVVNVQPNLGFSTEQGTIFHHAEPHPVQVTPNIVHHSVPNIPHQIQPNLVHPFQPNINVQPQPSIFQQSPQPNASEISPLPSDQPGIIQQEQPHNYFYFARRLPNLNGNNINNQVDFGHQENIQPQINYDQSFQDSSQQQEQGYDDQSAFFQPGKTDLQIPGYLPPHPQLRSNEPEQEYQNNQEQVQKR